MINPNDAILATMLAITLLLAGCETEKSGPQDGPEMPSFDNPALAEGRSIWMGTCRACHLLGSAGAPAVTDYANWEPRLAKGMPALYKGPINGIKDEQGKYKMPPRAGNNRLADSQIRRAADYMVAAVRHLHRPAQSD